MITTRIEIKRPATRIAFRDEGRSGPDSRTVWYDKEKWWDQITARDGGGTDLGFADGHNEYWKRDNPRTIEVAETDYNQWQGSGCLSNPALQYGNEDLHKVKKGAWDKLGYIPSQQP